MASGLADYASEIRPRSGGALWDLFSDEVDASDITSMISVNGKGAILGGFVFLDSAASQKNGLVRLKIDGVFIAGLAFHVMVEFGISKPWTHPLYLLCYDEQDYKYSIGLSGGITFEESFELLYEESDGATPLVVAYVNYAVL